MEFIIGQIVLSCAGRDKGEYFVVTSVEEPYVYLVDGKLRKTDKPKKKKGKHLKPQNYVSQLYLNKLEVKGKVSNSDVRTVMDDFLSHYDD